MLLAVTLQSTNKIEFIYTKLIIGCWYKIQAIIDKHTTKNNKIINNNNQL